MYKNTEGKNSSEVKCVLFVQQNGNSASHNDKPVGCSFGDNIGDCLVYSHQPISLQNGETNIEGKTKKEEIRML